MKREHNQLDPLANSDPNSGKAKMWEDDMAAAAADGGMDELLAVLGYKVKSSDMAEVAQKLDQLEEAMCSGDGFSQLASDSVHYDPSNLSMWLEGMLSKFNLDAVFDPSTLSSINFRNHQRIFEEACTSDYDLTAIPGKAMCNDNTVPVSSSVSTTRDHKRLKTELYSSESTRPVLLADSQESRIRLVHLLIVCAEAVQQNNLAIAKAFVKNILLLYCGLKFLEFGLPGLVGV